MKSLFPMTLREMPGGTLSPDTMKQYDDYTIREAFHNCIAYQDYTMQQRVFLIVVVSRSNDNS